MNMTFGGITRTVGLWVLILADAALIGLLFWKNQIEWATFVCAITVAVLVWELVTYIRRKKTISTVWKDWILAEGQEFYARLGILLFWLAMTGLAVHLWFF